MDSLGIEVDASDSDNMKTLQRMKNETGEFTYNEVVARLGPYSRGSPWAGRLGAVC